MSYINQILMGDDQLLISWSLNLFVLLTVFTVFINTLIDQCIDEQLHLSTMEKCLCSGNQLSRKLSDRKTKLPFSVKASPLSLRR